MREVSLTETDSGTPLLHLARESERVCVNYEVEWQRHNPEPLSAECSPRLQSVVGSKPT